MDVSKVEQQSYVKITFMECHAELQEALGDRTLPYRTVARWVEAFKRGCIETVDLPCCGRQSLLTHRCKWLLSNTV